MCLMPKFAVWSLFLNMNAKVKVFKKVTDFWDVTWCSFVDGYHLLRGICCLHLVRQQVLLNHWYHLPNYMPSQPRRLIFIFPTVKLQISHNIKILVLKAQKCTPYTLIIQLQKWYYSMEEVVTCINITPNMVHLTPIIL